MRELECLLPELNPPPGGLIRLQRSLRTRREPARTRNWRRLPAAAGACALAMLALAWLPTFISHQHQADALTKALLQTVAPSPLANGIRVDDGAALPLSSGQANTRVYLIASAPATKR
jgi:hypothetical protein